MKKITAGILTAVLVIALGGATVSAVGMGQAESGSAVQDRDRTQEQIYKTTDGNCVYYEDGNCRGDSDGDGICDYRESVSGTADAAYGSGVCGNGWHHSSGSGNGSAHGAHGYGHGHGCR